jgi:Domain of unknown function (DUF4438), N-terminal/Domain of unknown function (DUF4438), C-terminal
MKLRTNIDKLVRMGVSAHVDPPFMRSEYRISPDGQAKVLPSVGGVVYNVLCGDLALGWAADHIEPGASVGLPHKDAAALAALSRLAQVGNTVRVLSGAAKGARGIVTGKHGGIEHLMVDFAVRDLKKLASGDTVQVDAFGLGLELLDFPQITAMNIDPEFLKKLRLSRQKGKLVVPVALSVPAELMGSGLGHGSSHSGDYDLQCSDPSSVKRWNIEKLRLGDIIAITDADHTYGRIFRKGAITVGIVSHGDCVQAGHGPGVTTLLTSATGAILPKRSPKANLASIMKIGRSRGKKR